MIVLDEQLNEAQIALDISRWYKGTVINVLQLRPQTRIFDDVIPALLRRAKQPTFVTINYADFWGVIDASPDYCVVCLKLPTERAPEVPSVLRQVLGLPEFRTKRARMGYVISVRDRAVDSYGA